MYYRKIECKNKLFNYLLMICRHSFIIHKLNTISPSILSGKIGSNIWRHTLYHFSYIRVFQHLISVDKRINRQRDSFMYRSDSSYNLQA